MSSQNTMAGPKTRRHNGFGVKCAILHMIVIGGLFLMPGGCPSPQTGVTLTTTTSGQGSVACDPDSATYDAGTEVTLTATPAQGWAFSNWDGDLTGTDNPATVTMDSSMSITAVFTELGASSEWTQTDITSDTTIPAGDWLVNDSITVENGVTLTIAPGTTLRFADSCYLWVASGGALIANGTSTDPILLTWQGATAGFWDGVRFADSNSVSNSLQYVTIEYGGANYYNADLTVTGTSRVNIDNCTLSNSSGLGFGFYDTPTVTFSNNTVTGNDTAGEIETDFVGRLTTTSAYTGNTHDVIKVTNGTVSTSQTWAALGVDYSMNGSLTVDNNNNPANLTISPGVTLVFGADEKLWVTSTGSLTANGTAPHPIVLTASSQTKGYWDGVRFADSNDVKNSLQYVTIEYGGANYYNADLTLTGTSRVNIDHCYLLNSSGLGFGFYDTPTVTSFTNCTVKDNDTAGEIEANFVGEMATSSAYTGNKHDVIKVTNGTVSTSQTWPALGVNYSMDGSLTVDNANLTISPGATLVFGANEKFWVTSTGSLTANGTSGSPIVLTASSTTKGYWDGVRFADSNSVNNTLQYVTIEYGGANYDTANLTITGTSRVNVDHCTIRHSSNYGIYKDSAANVTITIPTYQDNATNVFTN